MRSFLIALSVILLSINCMAHEIQENQAKISIYQGGSVMLNLSIHQNSWTNKFKVQNLDDEILKSTQLTINAVNIPLKLRKIEKSDDHYFIQYISTKSLDSKVNDVTIKLPHELENTVITLIRSTTKHTSKGKVSHFNFK